MSYDRAGPEPSEPPSTAATTPVTALTGATWRLADVDTGSPPVLHPVIGYTLSVAGTDVGPAVVRLDDSCNLTNVPVVLGAGTFVVTGQALTTAVECNRPDDPVVTAAVRVFAAPTITWSVEGDDLTLRGAGTTLTFTRA